VRPLAEQFRDRIIRMVVPDRPASMVIVHQAPALDDACNLLADCTEAKRLLLAKGYGAITMSVLEIVQLLPLAPQRLVRKRKGRR